MVHITFLHPDLGIGGAERLVVDAAVALKKKGHNVHMVTTHHDCQNCFEETRDGTIPVTVVGTFLPRHIFGKFVALCAYIRMIYAAFYIVLCHKNCPDVVFCDLVSVCIPVLKLRIPFVIFYCHYPDQLLTQADSTLKYLYRILINRLEEVSIKKADKIFINSLFTQKVFYDTFKTLQYIETEVLYPSVNTECFDKVRTIDLKKIICEELPSDSCILLSINRYERKKKIETAITALTSLKSFNESAYNKTYLIIAGGFDERIKENVDYRTELLNFLTETDISKRVFFLYSVSDIEKISILKHCDILIYTPPNEHFGIVPLEAMYLGKPVFAHNSGGPQESVMNGKTGYLVNNAEELATQLIPLILSKALRDKMGKAGKERFENMFSFTAFSNHLNNSILKMMDKKMS